MGAIELQVFVGLVVILGAAFVALICDFLKGNNEQLRESNIELKVRQDERDKRDQMVQEVQRQTIEVVAQIQRVTGQRVTMPAAKAEPVQAAAAPVAPMAPTAPVVKDARTLFEQAEQARQGRGRRERRRMAETAVVERPPVAVEPQSPAAWAQEVYLRRFPQGESKRTVQDAGSAPEQPVAAPVQPATVQPQEDIRTVLARTEPAASETLSPVVVEPVRVEAAAVQPEVQALVESALPEPVLPIAPPLALESPEQSFQEEAPQEVVLPVAAEPEPEPLAEVLPEMAGRVGLETTPASWPGRVHGGGEPVVVVPQTELPAARSVVPEVAPGAGGLVALEHAAVSSATAPVQSAVQSLNGESDSLIPRSGLLPVAPEAAPVPAVEAQEVVEALEEVAGIEATAEEAVPASNVVRIRVLREEEVVLETASVEQSEQADAGMVMAAEAEAPLEVLEVVEAAPAEAPAAAAAEVMEIVEAAEVEAPEPVMEIPEPVAAEPVAEEPAVAETAVAEPVTAEEEVMTVFEPSEWRWSDEPETAETIWLEAPVVEAEEPAPVAEEAMAGRSNVLEMPAMAAPKPEPELVVPGGYHEPHALARLMEEPAPFRGLVMAVSLVDYVRLLADQGKPAMEQLMGSVSRQVVSMTREQDFACRIGEDEFVLLFVKEGGAAAKRRIQSVAERLWDFQLRSLGSMSVLFTWGAAETAGEPLSQVVERAREQMIESRRSRRSLGGGTGRFRRAAND